jgi:hypothetical protein
VLPCRVGRAGSPLPAASGSENRRARSGAPYLPTAPREVPRVRIGESIRSSEFPRAFFSGNLQTRGCIEKREA